MTGFRMCRIAGSSFLPFDGCMLECTIVAQHDKKNSQSVRKDFPKANENLYNVCTRSRVGVVCIVLLH